VACLLQVPLIIPIVVLTISIYLIAAPIIENPQIEYLYAALFIVAGLVFYVPFVYYGIVPWFMGMYALPHRLLHSHISAQA
jgi:L-type amino acid transporter 9